MCCVKEVANDKICCKRRIGHDNSSFCINFWTFNKTARRFRTLNKTTRNFRPLIKQLAIFGLLIKQLAIFAQIQLYYVIKVPAQP